MENNQNEYNTTRIIEASRKENVKHEPTEKYEGVKYEKTEKPAMSIAAFVFSVAGLVSCPTFVLSIIPNFLGLIFGIIGLKRGMKSLAVSAIIISIISMLLGVVFFAGIVFGITELIEELPEIVREIESLI